MREELLFPAGTGSAGVGCGFWDFCPLFCMGPCLPFPSALHCVGGGLDVLVRGPGHTLGTFLDDD